MSNKKTWFITGAGRGMGLDFAKAGVLSRRGKVGLIQCDDEVRAISQVVSKMCFGRSGRYSNGKIDQADRFRQYWIRALVRDI